MAHKIRKQETVAIAEPSIYNLQVADFRIGDPDDMENAIQYWVNDKVFTSIFSPRNDIGSIR